MRRSALSAAVLLLTLVAAACGDDEAPAVASLERTSTTLTDQDPQVDTEQQVLRFAECMREQGIDLPDPTVDAEGNVEFVPPPGFQPADLEEIFDAAENCEEFLEGVSLGFDTTDLAAATDVLLDFSACMRENGFDLPDPDFSFAFEDPENVPPAGPFGDVDLEDPAFLAAFAACQDIIGDLGTVGN